MIEVIVWVVVVLGIAGLAASIYIGEHGPVEPTAPQDEQEYTHAV